MIDIDKVYIIKPTKLELIIERIYIYLKPYVRKKCIPKAIVIILIKGIYNMIPHEQREDSYLRMTIFELERYKLKKVEPITLEEYIAIFILCQSIIIDIPYKGFSHMINYNNLINHLFQDLTETKIVNIQMSILQMLDYNLNWTEFSKLTYE